MMKIINYIISLTILAMVVFTSCSDNTDPKIDLGNIDGVPAKIITPQSGKEYVFLKKDYYTTFEEFTLQIADYGLPLGQKHALEVDAADGTFEAPIEITSSFTSKISVVLIDMNAALHKLGVEEIGVGENGEILYAPLKVKVRIATQAYGGEEGQTPIEGAPILYSQPIELTITPCEDLKPAYPTELYMIGDEFGNWNWEDAGIAEMVPVNDKPGMFWGINYFTAGKGFKWAPKKGWGNDFSELAESEGFVIVGGNATVESSGLYMVFINMPAKKITLAPAAVFGIGGCFGDNWDPGVAFTTSDKLTSITTTSAGALRMYAKPLAEGIDWWRQEFIIFDGKIAYRGNGGDQEAVQVGAGKTVTLNFAEGTGTIE